MAKPSGAGLLFICIDSHPKILTHVHQLGVDPLHIGIVEMLV